MILLKVSPEEAAVILSLRRRKLAKPERHKELRWNNDFLCPRGRSLREAIKDDDRLGYIDSYWEIDCADSGLLEDRHILERVQRGGVWSAKEDCYITRTQPDWPIGSREPHSCIDCENRWTGGKH